MDATVHTEVQVQLDKNMERGGEGGGRRGVDTTLATNAWLRSQDVAAAATTRQADLPDPF